jgi:hypothetical protein
VATHTFSARWAANTLDLLARRSDAIGTTKSRLAERYVEEGLRGDEHPGIVFRGGPSGRRAALAAGPDVWEVVSAMQATGVKGEAAFDAAAEALDVKPEQIRVAVRYYADYPDEIDRRIQRNVEEADAAEAAWRREQAALA